MPRMEKATPTPPIQPTATRETVTKLTEQVPATSAPIGSKPYVARTSKDDPSQWFKGLSPEERNDYAYYLYRLEPNIVIMDPNLDDRARGGMLDKLTPQDIQGLSQGDFLDELKLLVKQRYGGGKFQVKIVHLKGSSMVHNRALVIDGDPILSKREGWVGSGMLQAGQSGSGDAQTIPILLRFFEEKLAAITQRKEDPSQALSEVMKAGLESQNSAFQWILANMPKAPDPTQRISELKEMLQLFAMLKGEEKPVPAPLDSMAQMRQMLEMWKLFREAEAPPQPNIRETIKNAIAEGMKQLAGAKRGVGPAFADTVLDVVKAASPILAPIGLAIAEKIKHAPIPGVPSQAQPMMPPSQPRIGGVTSARGHAMLGASAPPMATAPAPPENRGAVQPTVLTEDLMAAASWHTITTQLVDMLRHDKPGDQAAASLENIFPDVTVRMRSMTEDMLTAFIAQDATLAQIKDDPRLPQFIGDFLGYFQAPETPGDEPPPDSAE